MTTWFTEPRWLVLLAAIPLAGTLAWRARRERRRALAALGNASKILSLPPRRGRWALTALFLALLAIAAAGPRWGDGPPLPIKPGCDAMLVIDVSRSMQARDVLPNRTTKARDAALELADAVRARGGHWLGLVAFAGQARLVCPLTHDIDHVRSKIVELATMPLPPNLVGTFGTRIGAGITAAIDAFDESHRGAQMIVLFSDGDDPAGGSEWRSGAAAARRAGIPIFAVGIGDAARDSTIPNGDEPLTFHGQPAMTRLRTEPLREIATATVGALMGEPDLTAFVRTTMDKFPTREAVAGTLPQPAPRHFAFLAAALVFGMLLCVDGFRPRFGLPAAALLLVAAVSAPDAALRSGLTALDSGQHEVALREFAIAAERTTDPGLVAFNQGIALFHLQRHSEAVSRFRWSLADADGPRRARAHYNLGCALLQSSAGRDAALLREAIAAFESAVGDEHLDAEHRLPAQENLELSRRLLMQLKNAPPPAESGSGDPRSPSASNSGRGDNAGEPQPGSTQPGDRENAKASGRPTDRAPPPGAGRLVPVPGDEVKPLSAEEARAEFARAIERIEAARQAHRQMHAAPPSSRFPDW